MLLSPLVPGQPGKFKVGKVTDTSIELTWEPAYTKEGTVNYELLYKPVKFGSLVRPLSLLLLSFYEPVCWLDFLTRQRDERTDKRRTFKRLTPVSIAAVSAPDSLISFMIYSSLPSFHLWSCRLLFFLLSHRRS